MRGLRAGVTRGRIVAAVVAAAIGVFAFGPSSASAIRPTTASVHTDTIRSGEYWLDQYGIRSAWSTTEGKGITIAVIEDKVFHTSHFINVGRALGIFDPLYALFRKTSWIWGY